MECYITIILTIFAFSTSVGLGYGSIISEWNVNYKGGIIFNAGFYFAFYTGMCLMFYFMFRQ